MPRATVRRCGVWLAVVCAMGASSAGAEWPLIWDFDGRTDDAVAAQLGSGGDLWVLTSSSVQGGSTPRAVLLRIDAQGALTWASDEPEISRPVAFALNADGEALVLGRIQSNLRVTAFGPEGQILWSRTRAGLDNDEARFGPDAAPIWDAAGAAWRIPVGIAGDFAAVSFSASGDPLPDRIWSPPSGTAQASSVLPRPDGGLLISGSADVSPSPPGWWTVALDAAGAEVWSRFEDGDTASGVFSGAFLLSSDPVRVWADDETTCGLFSLRLWSFDATTGTPLWEATWPAVDTTNPCRSMTPRSAMLVGNRIVASGISNVFSPTSAFDSVALSFDATTGALAWARSFVGATGALSNNVASTDGGALLATSLFPVPNPGPSPLWLTAWDSEGVACSEPTALLPARVLTTLATADTGWIVVGSSFNSITADDVIVQRTDNPCLVRFVDGFESE